jgi:hypothetical protein
VTKNRNDCVPLSSGNLSSLNISIPDSSIRFLTVDRLIFIFIFFFHFVTFPLFASAGMRTVARSPTARVAVAAFSINRALIVVIDRLAEVLSDLRVIRPFEEDPLGPGSGDRPLAPYRPFRWTRSQ